MRLRLCIIMDMASSSSSNIQKIETTSSSKEEANLSATIHTVTMEKLQHFSHEHPLSLVQLQPQQKNEISHEEDDDEDEDKDDVVEEPHVGTCEMCKEDIYSFHLCYYSCADCDYSLHNFCAQLPITQQNHPLHPNHNLTLSDGFQFQDPNFNFIYNFDDVVECNICEISRKRIYNYHCSICDFTMDMICATMSKQKMDHPSHPHQLQRYFRRMISHCNACDEKHSGTFYQCTACCFMIHLDCALLPAKLLIQRSTKNSFTHTHLLTLAYSFPHNERRARFYPLCRVCDEGFFTTIWHYRCDKCRYYAHVDCATSMSDAFMSILSIPGLGKTSKNFEDSDHPSLIRYPFPNESFNLIKHLFISKGKLTIKRKIDGEMFSHPHPLILFETLHNGSVSLHDPMKQVELLCNGCVRPITDLPFYKCSEDDCGFVLHEWCTRLPSEIQDHYGHPNHTLVLQPQFGRSFGVFICKICKLCSNGFTYGCIQCRYYVDIHCAFIPDVITHEAHSDHLLQRIVEASPNLTERFCRACSTSMEILLGFQCHTCDFYLHTNCALLLPGKIRHKYDKHSLSLRYNPAENHSSEYFCEICEDEFNPNWWFYHCNTCASSMHTACAPLKLQCEQSVYPDIEPVFVYLNVKFGRTLEITDHPHPLTFVQGVSVDGKCDVCDEQLQHYMIFKCSQCKFARHCWCP